MRIGFIGLGRMGANMVRRCLRDGHEIVAYNRTPEKTREIAGEGATAAFSIAELVEKLEKPRAVWVMVPAGDATEAQIEELLEHLEPGDTIIDGGNTNFHDDVRRHKALAEKGIGYVDAGTSGGIWGLQVGYALMVGGDRDVVAPLEPIFKTLAPEGGYLHVGGPGAGHYVKMVHNGIEYGLMQAYAEGFEIMHASDYGLDLAAISEMWMHGSVVRSLAARAPRPGVQVRGPGPGAPQGLGRGLRRGPLDRPGGDRPRRPGAGDHALAADAVPVAPGRLLRRQGARRAAQRVRRARGQDRVVATRGRTGRWTSRRRSGDSSRRPISRPRRGASCQSRADARPGPRTNPVVAIQRAPRFLSQRSSQVPGCPRLARPRPDLRVPGPVPVTRPTPASSRRRLMVARPRTALDARADVVAGPAPLSVRPVGIRAVADRPPRRPDRADARPRVAT